MFQLAIIADDLTGAMDTGVQFAKRGLRTVVSLTDRLDQQVASKADVLVLNTDSRPDAPKVARQKLITCGRYVRELGVSRVYKKIDSTLRGNVGVELDGLMTAWQVQTVVLTPAFPAVGRTVLGGVLMVNDEPWEKTQYAEGSPVESSFVGDVIQSPRRIANVELADLRRGEDHVVKRLKDIAEAGGGVVVADAVCREDLAVVVRAAVRAGLDRIMCGSGGLAEELPEAMSLAGQAQETALAVGKGCPVLVVAGTVNPVTIAQVRNAQRAARAAALEMLPVVLQRDPDLQRQRLRGACESALTENRDLIVVSVPLSEDLSATMMSRNATVAATLGPVVAGSLRPGDWAGMVLTGGDTAVALCKALGVGALAIEGEVEPGVPYGRLLEGPLAGLLVVTKAGGFGSPEAIAKAISFIRGKTSG
ncbi:MAG: four-carbon acid sugar kinase family protein [Chloroflexota bacterium]